MFRVGILSLLAAQNAGLTLIIKYAQHHGSHPDTLVLMVVVELGKLVVSMVLFFMFEADATWIQFFSPSAFRRSLMLAPPALMFAFQNQLLFVAVQNLDPPVFQALTQLKILFAGVFSRLLLQRRLSVVQWVALLLLASGAALVQVEASMCKASGIGNDDADPFWGLVAVTTIRRREGGVNVHVRRSTRTSSLGAGSPWRRLQRRPRWRSACQGMGSSADSRNPCGARDIHARAVVFVPLTMSVMSGLAGCYTEKMLKTEKLPMWLQSAEVAGFSIVVLMFMCTWSRISTTSLDTNVFGSQQTDSIMDSLMRGFVPLTWVVVAVMSLGGLIVVAALRYADNVMKGMSVVASLVLSGVWSALAFGTSLSAVFVIATIVICAAMFLYQAVPFMATSDASRAVVSSSKVAKSDEEAPREPLEAEEMTSKGSE
ncbi:unnamed protein product [Prorocentrum cordatum]|uniref:UDP-galactose transporter n=1 Tax=Prorocentrum cordatum TaxID=2364126 RepID=A0ABN9PQR4_9DINO|nr:unnamed protein product [Polarella glacialis]